MHCIEVEDSLLVIVVRCISDNDLRPIVILDGHHIQTIDPLGQDCISFTWREISRSGHILIQITTEHRDLF